MASSIALRLVVLLAAAVCSLAALRSPLASTSHADRPGVRYELSQMGADGLSYPALFEKWYKAQGKTYVAGEEYARRLGVFQSNLKYIMDTNAADGSVRLALNEFADLTWDEFRASHLGLLPNHNLTQRRTVFQHGNVVTKQSVDWVAAGAVTPVKNQLFCGSCWAFSATGSVEGANFLATGELVSLSEQELVDCDTAKDMGCGGGLMDNAFEFIIANGGLDTEKDYSYWSVGEACNARRLARTIVSIDSYEDIPANDEGALAKAVTKQPVSVAICASQNLQFYASGVLSEPCCTALDHGVLAVGYGTDERGAEYWKVKNSWGGSWGEAGYFRLAKGVTAKEGQCGIAMMASYPVKTSPNPKRVPEVCGWFGFTSCEYGTSCECRWEFFNLLCLSWGCNAAPSA